MTWASAQPDFQRVIGSPAITYPLIPPGNPLCISSILLIRTWHALSPLKSLVTRASLDWVVMANIASTLTSYRPWAAFAFACAALKFATSLGPFTLNGFLLHLGPWGFGLLSIWAVYSVVVYPKYLSPLRHLPQPEVGYLATSILFSPKANISDTRIKGASFINGHWAASVKEPAGLPFRHWSRTIPNDGLIRYLYV